MHTGLRNAVRVDQPTRKMIMTPKKGEECCCCTEEPVVDTTTKVPAAQSKPDWQKEEPPYFHREIF